MSKIRLDIDIATTDIESVVYVSDYILEITFADEKVKQIDFAPMMQEMADGKFLDMEQFKSYTFNKEILYWGKREIVFYNDSIYGK